MGRINRPRWEWLATGLVILGVVGTAAADGATRPKVPKPPVTKATIKATTNFGKLQAKNHKAGVTRPPIVPFIRTLSYTKKSNAGCVAARPPNVKKHKKAVAPTCPAIFQMQRALKAAKFRPAKAHATGVFGKATRDQVKKFQKARKIPPSGVYGTRTHKALTRYYDLVGRKRLQTVAHDRKAIKIFAAFKTVGAHARVVGGTTLTYSQSSSRGFLPRYPRLPPATDCSGFVTWMYQSVGLPDPNGFNFRPVGYTGTLALHGVRVTNWNQLHVGDLVLYGGGFPYGHVTIVVDAFRRLVLSHGSRGVRLLPFNYRRVSVIRRYYS